MIDFLLPLLVAGAGLVLGAAAWRVRGRQGLRAELRSLLFSVAFCALAVAAALAGERLAMHGHLGEGFVLLGLGVALCVAEIVKIERRGRGGRA